MSAALSSTELTEEGIHFRLWSEKRTLSVCCYTCSGKISLSLSLSLSLRHTAVLMGMGGRGVERGRDE